MEQSHRFLRWKWKILIVIVIVVCVVASVEIGFRVFLKVTGKSVITVLSKKEILEKAWFEPHPYLVYIFKSNHSFTMKPFKNRVSKFTTNKFGFRSTLEYDVKTVSKPTNTLRIATFGGSTTMGVNDDDEIWPYIIGKNMEEHVHDRKIEILNEGVMGYTSLENLLDLDMRVIDFNCDVYILYLGVNDLIPRAPLDTFRTDYAHFRKTLHENLNLSSLIPSCLLKLKSFRAVLQILGFPDSRDLLANTGTVQFRKRFEVPQEEITIVNQMIRQTLIRNIISMIGTIHCHNPDALIIVSSFYDLLDRETIQEMNQDLSKLTNNYNIIFVDAANQIPRVQAMAYDYGHFTPEGDRKMGAFFTHAILTNLEHGLHQEKGKY